MKGKDEVRNLRENGYVMIDDVPCKILSITTSKPGKHGEAKARIEAIGIFDTQKRSLVYPVKHKVDIPMIEKRRAMVLNVSENIAQLMDMQTYETFEIPIQEGKKIESQSEVTYIAAFGKRKIED